jgi:hypothetical protein
MLARRRSSRGDAHGAGNTGLPADKMVGAPIDRSTKAAK